MSDSAQDHDAPLRHLVAALHAGTTLRERVIRLRYRRRKAKPLTNPTDAVITNDECETNNNEAS